MPRVYIARADDYRAPTLQAAMGRALDGFAQLGGRHVVAKVNEVFADRRLARACYTRPEVVRAALDRLFQRSTESHVTLIGNAGAGMPTAVSFERARGEDAAFRKRGYWALESLYPGRLRIEPTDEGRLAEFVLSLGPRVSGAARHDWRLDPGPEARWWRSIKTSAVLAEADRLVFFPKLKTNVLGQGLTGACKLGGIGLLLDEDRMDGHNFHNDRRIADMLEIARPDLIVTDAVDVAFGGNQMTERGHRLGVIIVADDPLAHDVVACHILGLDPSSIGHLRICAARGWGSLDLADVELVSEIPLETLRARAAGFGPHGAMPVERFGERFRAETGWTFPMEIISGPPYEHAGAQGVLLDWLYFSYDDPRRWPRMAGWPPSAGVIGEFDRLPSDRNALVFAIGRRACEAFGRQTTMLRRIPLPGWLRNALGGPAAFVRYGREGGGRGWAVLFDGDPPTHRDLILGFVIATGGRMLAPFFRPDLIYVSYVRMLGTWLRRALRNRGPLPRVEAAEIARMTRYRPDRVDLSRA